MFLVAPPLMSPDTDVSPEAPEKNIQHDSGQSLQDRMLRRPDKGPGMKHSDSQVREFKAHKLSVFTS